MTAIAARLGRRPTADELRGVAPAEMSKPGTP